MIHHDPAPSAANIFVIDRDFVTSGNVAPVLDALYRLKETQEAVRANAGTVEVVFEGYGADPRELYEIGEVRAYIAKLHAYFPWWFHFGCKTTDSLFVIVASMLTLKRIPSGESGVVANKIDGSGFSKILLELFMASNQLYAQFGLTEQENNSMTRQVDEYFRTFMGA